MRKAVPLKSADSGPGIKSGPSPGYFRQYVGDKDVGAFHPSSRFLVRRLLRCLDASRIKTIVEFGPGPGIATRPVLDVLPSDARYIAIEKNPVFLTALRTSIADPRLLALEGDARSAAAILSERGITRADAVIASIPFSFLSREERRELVASVYSFLAADGDFVIFHQYSTMMRSCLETRFPYVDVQFELRNIFPCFLIHSRKQAPPSLSRG
jgi:phospholipid N-methyltransferase